MGVFVSIYSHIMPDYEKANFWNAIVWGLNALVTVRLYRGMRGRYASASKLAEMATEFQGCRSQVYRVGNGNVGF